MNVAIYARVSTHDKDQNPETQLRPLRQHLAGLKGVSVLGEFIDKAGADDLRGRREWRRLLELALSGKADLIIVWKLDRAFRSVVDGANTLQSLRSGGCGIRSLQEPWIDTTTPIGEAMYHITIAWVSAVMRDPARRRSERSHGRQRTPFMAATGRVSLTLDTDARRAGQCHPQHCSPATAHHWEIPPRPTWPGSRRCLCCTELRQSSETPRV